MIEDVNMMVSYDTPSPYSSDLAMFRQIVAEMTDTFIRKNHDYGNSYADSIRELGLVAGFTPILHKCNRLKTLVKGENAMVNESIRDSLLDMANYCVLMAMELDKNNVI